MTISYMISTGPMEEDWLVAEINVDGEQFAELWEWGEKIIFFAKPDGQPWNISLGEFLHTIEQARERVRLIRNDEEK